MPDIENYSVYNDRMRRSMWDKAFFMDKIPGTRLIIDYGCADGSLIRFLGELFPAMLFIGFDIDASMIEAARKHHTGNAWFFTDMEEALAQIQALGIPGESVAVNFSSVFHEVFHYGFDLTALAGFLRAVDPRYLVVRDMMYLSKNPLALVPAEAEERVRSVLPRQQIRDFEACWGSIRLRRNLAHLLLKYKYTENWARECAENYFSVTEEALAQALNPENRYRRILFHTYVLPWCRHDAEERFHIDLGEEFTTHFTLILSARDPSRRISLNEGGNGMSAYSFDAAKARDGLVEAIRRLAREQGFERVVVGISGGKDSTVTAALCARALGKENVFGVMLPDGAQKDLDDSRRVCDTLGIQKRVINIGPMHEALKAATDQKGAAANEGEFTIPVSRVSDINVGPRLRMTTLRYIAQALGARLAGTGNLSEITVGYCTKDGDTSCDFSVLGALTSVEVVEVGLTMDELPRDLVQKTPSDGLTGRSDEENLGVTYQEIHRYIRLGGSGNGDADEIIRRKERANMHKRHMPRVLSPFGGEGT